MKKMNKTKAVLLHLMEVGHINTWEANEKYGATRLSAIIFNLRYRYNLNIVNERISFVDRYGTKSHYDNYYLNSKVCPKCLRGIDGYPAISRKDNKTEICSKCGELEALEDFSKYLIERENC